MHEPLEIVFNMGSPVLLVHPFIALDSLVLYACAKDHHGEEFYKLPSNVCLRDDDLLPADYPIPITRHECGLYHASFSIFEEDIYKLARFHYVRRRFEDKYIQHMKPVKKIGINKGTLKNYNTKYVQISPRQIRFYCHGEKNDLYQLLNEYIHGLGKKVNSGNGTILSISINECKQDYSFIMDGKATRPIPGRFLKSFTKLVPMTWIPPYWARDKIEMCAPPGSEIELNEEMACLI